MTGAALPAPGWYPDPSGAPGVLRWWTGAAWSEVAVPAGPALASPKPPATAPPATEPTTGAPTEPSAARRRPRWLLPLLTLAVVLLVAGVLRVTSAAHAPAPSAAAPPLGRAFPPGTVRIVDSAGGISYPFLGPGWFEYDLSREAEETATAGQYFVTQESVPGGGEFVAQCTSGPVADRFGWTGADSLATTAHALADSKRALYYPAPNERRVRREEARTVAGHAAYLYEFELTWRRPGYQATGERAALLLVDVGRPAPALLYVSIPNTHAELYGDIDRVLDGVSVP